MVSKKYLDDTKRDEGNVYIFSQGILLFSEVRIRDALKCFKKCEGSNFNCIELWNYIAKCYMKLGEHSKSIKYIDDVISLDKNNEEAFKIKAQLVEFGFVAKDTNGQVKRNLIVGLCAMIIFGLLGVGIFKGYNQIGEWVTSRREAKNKQDNEIVPNLDNFQGNTEEYNSNTNNDTKENVETKVFEGGILKLYIEAEDYENIIKYIDTYKEDELHINDKLVIQSGIDLVEDKGILYLYEKGVQYMDANKYKEAIELFKLGYEYSSKSYLNEHILFMIGVSCESIGDVESSNKYYEVYVDEYLDGGAYIEQCIYSLAISNVGIDDKKAEKYAAIIEDKFSESEFNNTKIKGILE